MKKGHYKLQASSSRAASVGFGRFGSVASSSSLSYYTEPPDLSTIGNPHVVVAFKNLSKRDENTRLKALQDLRVHVNALTKEKNDVEDSVIEAWISVYPRLSIDSSRMVRDLSHSIQHDILSTSQKRLLPRVSRFVGNWLAGQFDRDRTVASNVRKAVRSLLPTDEKLVSFYARHQAATLKYAHDAIQESPETLSDERIMSRADMQAKYFIVIGSGISLVLELLQKLDESERSKLQYDYNQLFSAEKLWNLVSCEDSGIRQIICELMIQCCEKQCNIISKNLDIIRKAFISKGLLEPQQGSASKILDALRALTIKFPDFWELHHKSKASCKTSNKHPLMELSAFILAGPRLEAVNFWSSLSNLLKVLPPAILPKKTEDSIKFLQNLQASFSVRAGVRLAARNAWYCYVDVFELLVVNLADGESKSSLLRSTMFPLFNKYLGNMLASDQASDNLNNMYTTEIDLEVALRVYEVCSLHNEKDNDFIDEWENLGDKFIKKTLTSQSEHTINDQLSQDMVPRLSKLWFSLLAEVHRSYDGERKLYFHQEPIFVKSIDIIKAAFDFIIRHEGDSFCAARILENAIILAPDLLTSSPDRLIIIHDILTIHFSKILYSSSAAIIIPIMFRLPTLPGLEEKFESIWHEAVDTFLSTYRSMPTEVWNKTAVILISSNAITSISRNHQALQNFLKEEINYFVLGKHLSNSIIHAAFKFGVLSQSSAPVVMESLIEKLNDNNNLQRIFFVLDVLNKHMHHLMDIKCCTHIDLLLKLFAIEENASADQGIDSEIAKKSRELRAAIMSDSLIDSISKIVSIDLKKSGKSSHDLFLGHLIQEVKKSIHIGNSPKQLELLLPSTDDWSDSLNHLLDQPLKAALAATPDFGSVINLINRKLKRADSVVASLFDAHGFTMPMRKAIYTSQILFDWNYGLFSVDSQLKFLELTLLTLEIAQSDVNLLQSSFLFDLSLPPDDKNILMHFLKDTPLQLQAFAENSRSLQDLEQDLKENSLETASRDGISMRINTTVILWDLINEYIKICELKNPLSFYAGKALTRVLKILVKESNDETDLIENWISNLSIFQNPIHNIIGASAVLLALGKCGKSSRTVKNLCNRLISDLLIISIDSDDIVHKLILLNSCLAIYDSENLPIAQNRIVFSVQHVILWTEVVEDPCLVMEICRLLQRLLPSIKDIYGSFWEACIRFCFSIWTKQRNRPLVDEHLAVNLVSLKFYSSLNEIEDSNDDLKEALVELREQATSDLLELLFVERHANHKLLQQVDETLAKLIFGISPDKIESIDKFYPLLASNYFWIQSAAYSLIHKRLPALQQQLSVDIFLENRDASLPDELLLLIIAQPSNLNINCSDELFQGFSSEYLEVRSYLLAWLLVFEIFAASSYKVRSDLNNFLKSHNSIEPLLSLIFRILGHIDEKPLDLKKENISAVEIRNYNLLSSITTGNGQNDLIWILVSLYFQLLKYAPSIVKGWWLDTKKQIKNSICSWTERFISPILIEEELNSVRIWAENQDSLDDDQNLIIKVAKNVREIYVGYEIDDMVMRCLIRVPKSYPLDLVRVESINRVGISEQKWNSFLMTTNGVINFSNGSISDSLYIFRKNIISALKGQVECAICYSIISANRKLPDKTCGTCNNIFHSKCLFQWFKSSNQSNCPLCRTTFKY
ncbi:putative c3hc4 type zinc finger containing protein [Golovinomyces cichoracearum]|uniref:E3 ubiquitin-protein ligase listerin n=1 Tax=Golovinomyces cichoracearum TaxID=62708 RepID=A0A420IIZ6_9PEZI|nr:putative c3hc4 type zinc finger containing protein [Golovinomyces cichoracearum]